MLKKESSLDSFVYVLACILSFGTIWLTRIVISQAIRSAITNGTVPVSNEPGY